jgi:hypothetical protein
LGQEEFFSGFWVPTQHKKQDELLLPYPEQLCPILPWHHPPWPQIMAPQLPMSLLKAPSGRFAINTAGAFAWGVKMRPIKK